MLSWRWHTAAKGGIRTCDLTIASPAPYHSATAYLESRFLVPTASPTSQTLSQSAPIQYKGIIISSQFSLDGKVDECVELVAPITSVRESFKMNHKDAW